MNLSFFIARRYLVSKKSNNAINIISWISVCAIGIATAALVVVLSFMNGLTGLVQDLYNSFDPDIEITIAKGKNFIPDKNQIAELKKINGIKNISFSIEDNALLKYGDKQSVATIKGVDDEFFKMNDFKTMLKEGNGIIKDKYKSKPDSVGNRKFDSAYYAILGEGFMYQLSARTTDIEPLSMYAPKRGNKMVFSADDALNEEKIIPRSYFSINDEFNSRYVLVHLDVARKLFDYENEVNSIDIGLNNLALSDEVQQKIKNIFGEKFIVKNRFEQNKILFSTLKTEKLWVNILLICLLQLKLKFIPLEGTVTKSYPVNIELMDFTNILISVFIIGSVAAYIPVRFFTGSNAMQKLRSDS